MNFDEVPKFFQHFLYFFIFPTNDSKIFLRNFQKFYDQLFFKSLHILYRKFVKRSLTYFKLSTILLQILLSNIFKIEYFKSFAKVP